MLPAFACSRVSRAPLLSVPAFVCSGVCVLRICRLPGFACSALVCSGVCVLPAFACPGVCVLRICRLPGFACSALVCSGVCVLRICRLPGFACSALVCSGVCVLRRLHVPVFVGSRFLPEPVWRTPLPPRPPRKTESGAPLSVSGLSLPHGCAEVCRGCQSPSAKEWITTPERSLGSNHVVFGGMMLPVSAMLMSCCIETG